MSSIRASRRTARCGLTAVLVAGIACGSGFPAVEAWAQDGWNPFADAPLPGQRRPARPPLAPTDGPAGRMDAGRMDQVPSQWPQQTPAGSDVAPGGFAPRASVESTELPPLAADGPAAEPAASPASKAASPVGVPSGDDAAVGKLIAEIELPARSPAVSRLFVRLIGPGAPLGAAPEVFSARSIALYRAGRLAEASRIGAEDSGVRREGASAAAMAGVRARLALAAGQRDQVCTEVPALLQAGAGGTTAFVAEGIALQGYCGASSGNPAAAGLAASLGREQGVLPHVVAALDAVASGEAHRIGGTHRIGILEWRLAELAGRIEGEMPPLSRFELATLAAISSSETAPPRWRLLAGEAAVRSHAIDGAVLATIYALAAEPEQAAPDRADQPARRAAMFRAAMAERLPAPRARLIRAVLDDARRAGLSTPMSAALAPLVEEIRPGAEVGWFAETAVEVMLAAGRPDQARRWLQLAPDATGPLAHWSALVDIAEAPARRGRGASLLTVEEIALRGRFTAEGLHRLATVLDALDQEVPMRLWEAASRSPQPTTGHLPPTGVLSELQDAAKRRDHLRTASLVHRTLGPEGAEGAHMIALGDAIRALKRAGLEADARGVALEALLVLWPRSTSS